MELIVELAEANGYTVGFVYFQPRPGIKKITNRTKVFWKNFPQNYTLLKTFFQSTYFLV